MTKGAGRACVGACLVRRFLVDPPHRLAGVDYDALGDKINREDLERQDYHYARQLAGVHAFLAQW